MSSYSLKLWPADSLRLAIRFGIVIEVQKSIHVAVYGDQVMGDVRFLIFLILHRAGGWVTFAQRPLHYI
jgi:hypothetical protein